MLGYPPFVFSPVPNRCVAAQVALALLLQLRSSDARPDVVSVSAAVAAVAAVRRWRWGVELLQLMATDQAKGLDHVKPG